MVVVGRRASQASIAKHLPPRSQTEIIALFLAQNFPFNHTFAIHWHRCGDTDKLFPTLDEEFHVCLSAAAATEALQNVYSSVN